MEDPWGNLEKLEKLDDELSATILGILHFEDEDGV